MKDIWMAIFYTWLMCSAGSLGIGVLWSTGLFFHRVWVFVNTPAKPTIVKGNVVIDGTSVQFGSDFICEGNLTLKNGDIKYGK